MPVTLDVYPDADQAFAGCLPNAGTYYAACQPGGNYIVWQSGHVGAFRCRLANWPAIPATAMIEGIQVDIYVASTSGRGMNLKGYLCWSNAANAVISATRGTGTTTNTWLYGTFVPNKPGGTGWTITDANNLYVHVAEANPSTGPRPTIHQLLARLRYYNQPTVSGLTPSGIVTTSNPTASWSFAGDGLPQSWYTLKVFDDATYTDPGFDPEDSPAVHSAIDIASATSARTIDTNLSDATYRVYVKSAQNVGARKHYSNWIYTTITVARPPNAPVLTGPPYGQYANLPAGPTATWQYSHPSPTGLQGAWAFRRKADAGAYEYWQVDDETWQPTVVWNSGAEQVVDFPAGSWPIGPENYFWSVATQSGAGIIGPFASDSIIAGVEPPTVTIFSPLDPVTDTNRPMIAWDFSSPGSYTQEQFQIKVYNDVGVTNPPTAAFDTDLLWESGIVSSADDSMLFGGNPLDNGQNYQIFVRALAKMQWSPWAESDFSLDLTPPATPTMTVTNEPSQGRVKIDLVARNNVLPAYASTFEADVGDWNVTNGDTVRSEDQAKSGLSSMAITATAGGDVIAQTSIHPLDNVEMGYLMPVSAGTEFTGGLDARAATTARSVQLVMTFVDANGDDLTSSSTTTATNSTTAWTTYKVTATAPAGAVGAYLKLTIVSAGTGEVHYFDEVFFSPGPSSVNYTQSGFSSFAFTVECSDDGGFVWNPVRKAYATPVPASQMLTVYDYEVIPRKSRMYRAMLIGII